MDNQDCILKMRGIRKTFGSLVANDNVDFTVRTGSVHALVGENGAGKSTLMNILSGIYKPDSGEIIFKGKPVRFRDSLDAARHGIGMVYQEFMLCRDLSVLDNIMLGFEKKKAGFLIDRKKTRKVIEDICSKYNFNIPLDAIVKTLPVSMLQQVEIVKVLYRGADLIILDEPTSVLTPQGIEGLFDAIRFLTSKGKTIIIITHKLKEVFAIADEITVLKNGKVSGTVVPSEIDENGLANLMVGREVILQANKIEHELGQPVLSVENLSVKDPDGILRVKDATFDVKKGEIVGIAGVAGSGQQQLVEALFGIITGEPGGKIIYNGEDISSFSSRERRCRGIGYVPQDRLKDGVNVNSAIWETAIMGYHVAHGFSKKAFLSKNEIRDFTGNIIEDYAVKTQSQNDRVGSLSGGNIQKLVVGREFSQKNQLLIIEDPTRGIDVGSIEFIWQKIIEMSAQGVSVLLISHELNEVMELSDRILVIYNGKIKPAGQRGELTDKEIGLLMLGGDISEE